MSKIARVQESREEPGVLTPLSLARKKDVPIRGPVSGLLIWYLGARGLERLTMNILLVEFVGENTRRNGSVSYSRYWS